MCGVRGKAEPREVLTQPREPGFGAIDRRHARARGGELCSLAPGSCAKIDDTLARYVAEQAHRQRRRRVLHPPAAFGKTRKFGNPAGSGQSHRSGRKLGSAESCGRAGWIAKRGQVERWFVEVRRCNSPAGRLTVRR